MAETEQQLEEQRSHSELLALLLLLGRTRAQLQHAGIHFVWDASRSRYWSLASQSIVSPVQLRAWVDAAIQTTENRIAWLTRRLLDGRISYPQWATMVQQELKAEMVGLGQVAIGGRGMWDAAQSGRLGQRMRFLYQKLTDLGLEFEQGLVSEAQMLNRIGMAAHYGRNVFETLTRGIMKDAGYQFERNVLATGADHCGECPGLSDMGWQPIDSLPMIGERQCLTRDMCSMEYGMTAEG